MLPQGRFQAFLRARSEERHRLLQQLFRTGRFEDVERWLRDRRVALRRRSEAAHRRRRRPGQPGQRGGRRPAPGRLGRARPLRAGGLRGAADLDHRPARRRRRGAPDGRRRRRGGRPTRVGCEDGPGRGPRARRATRPGRGRAHRAGPAPRVAPTRTRRRAAGSTRPVVRPRSPPCTGWRGRRPRTTAGPRRPPPRRPPAPPTSSACCSWTTPPWPGPSRTPSTAPPRCAPHSPASTQLRTLGEELAAATARRTTLERAARRARPRSAPPCPSASPPCARSSPSARAAGQALGAREARLAELDARLEAHGQVLVFAGELEARPRGAGRRRPGHQPAARDLARPAGGAPRRHGRRDRRRARRRRLLPGLRVRGPPAQGRRRAGRPRRPCREGRPEAARRRQGHRAPARRAGARPDHPARGRPGQRRSRRRRTTCGSSAPSCRPSWPGCATLAAAAGPLEERLDAAEADRDRLADAIAAVELETGTLDATVRARTAELAAVRAELDALLSRHRRRPPRGAAPGPARPRGGRSPRLPGPGRPRRRAHRLDGADACARVRRRRGRVRHPRRGGRRPAGRAAELASLEAAVTAHERRLAAVSAILDEPGAAELAATPLPDLPALQAAHAAALAALGRRPARARRCGRPG